MDIVAEYQNNTKRAIEGTLKELSSMLPLKRIYEFVIIRYLLEYEEIKLDYPIV